MSHPRPKVQTELVIVIDDPISIPKEVIEAARRLPQSQMLYTTDANSVAFPKPIFEPRPQNEPFYMKFLDRRRSTRNK
jgi:hypothetical protein